MTDDFDKEEFLRRMKDGPNYASPDEIIKWQHEVIEQIFKNWQNNLIHNHCPHCKELGDVIKTHVTDLADGDFIKYMKRINTNNDK